MTDLNVVIVEQFKIYNKIKEAFEAYEKYKGDNYNLGLIGSRMQLLDKHCD